MKTGAYYNEHDPYAAQWLRNLIDAGHIAPGVVDERDIQDVQATDLDGFTQCHFFAGLGGWSHAMRLAGWPDSRPVWTGSPPCQDYSHAASIWDCRGGQAGPRGRLVGVWMDIIERTRPGVVFFENVPGIEKDGLAETKGRLESLGYAVEQSKRKASDIGALHQRGRVWLVADRYGKGLEKPRSEKPPKIKCSAWRAPPGNLWVAAPDRACGFSDGFPARVAAIRAYGNAIVPQVAAEVISAYMEYTA